MPAHLQLNATHSHQQISNKYIQQIRVKRGTLSFMCTIGRCFVRAPYLSLVGRCISFTREFHVIFSNESLSRTGFCPIPSGDAEREMHAPKRSLSLSAWPPLFTSRDFNSRFSLKCAPQIISARVRREVKDLR
jgi:hypothetical protein